MKTVLAFVIAFVLSASGASSQVTQNDPHRIQPILNQLGELDMANQILPLLLTRDQIRQLLPAIERCRKNIRDQEKKEADRLKELVPEIEKMYGEAVRGVVPTQEFLDKVGDLFLRFDNERKGVLMANGLILMEAVNQIFDEGQKKAAVGVVDKVVDYESMEWKDADEQSKLRFFTMNVLLNDRAYDFLTKLNTGR